MKKTVTEVEIDQVRELAKEAKSIALGAKREASKHICAKESELNHLSEAIKKSESSMEKMSITNVLVAEELGKWKWFRVLIVPVMIMVVTTAGGAFASFVYVKSDVEQAKADQEEARQELKEVRNAQKELMDTVKRREAATHETERSMRAIETGIAEVLENTKPQPSNKRRR